MALPTRIRIIVIGLGRMGHHHLRVLREMPEAFDVVGVVDRGDRPEDLGSIVYGRSLAEVPDIFDAAVIVTPTHTHDALARELIARGKHVLVEKPIAEDVARGEEMVRAAKERGVRLAVAHVERFNPAVRALRAVVGELGDLVSFSSTRVGLTDAPVLDLAVHDLDLLRTFVGPVRLSSNDGAELVLVSHGGVRASVRVATGAERIRRLVLAGTRGTCEVDYVEKTCALNGVALEVENEEPLRAQARALHRFIVEGDPGALCTAEDAIAALALATSPPGAAWI